MLNFNGEEQDMFFDSIDDWSSDDFIEGEVQWGSVNLDYDRWLNVPLSVEERREQFLSEMKFTNNASLQTSSPKWETRSARIDETEKKMETLCSSDSSHYNEGNSLCIKLEEDDHGVLGEESAELSSANRECEKREIEGKTKHWWRFFGNKSSPLKVSKRNFLTNRNGRMKVWRKKKEFKELSALYLGQEIQAHKGCVWSMKFSPDGQYLATGGEDRILRVWKVDLVDSSNNHITTFCNFYKHPKHGTVIIPEMDFQMEESPLEEFHGHFGEILDLAWSSSNLLLSSSMDKTVRLWKLHRKESVDIFHHPNYVTCIQFNPVDENYFLSGSVDGKVRIWGISNKRVIDWAEVREVITAICYQPDGNRFVVGTMEGTCSFYETSGEYCNLKAQICIEGRKKACGRRITGIQILNDMSNRVMIASEDSKLRILDGMDIIHKYRGLPNSGYQTSASFTSDEKHIISIGGGDDSRVYIWNFESSCDPFSKKLTKSTSSCEHFGFNGLSIAIPWLGIKTKQRRSSSDDNQYQYYSQTKEHSDKFLHCFSLSNWFSTNQMHRAASTTWPEEKLPLCNPPVLEHDHDHDHDQHSTRCRCSEHDFTAASSLWGLVIVTAGNDGIIRTFHNYGLPVRI